MKMLKENTRDLTVELIDLSFEIDCSNIIENSTLEFKIELRMSTKEENIVLKYFKNRKVHMHRTGILTILWEPTNYGHIVRYCWSSYC